MGAAVAFGKEAVGAAEESASAIAGLETVFRNAGDATGEAAADAVAYAGDLSALIGVEDEQIMAAQTIAGRVREGVRRNRPGVGSVRQGDHCRR